MVAVARALSGNVRLLLLDEPFEGLAPAVVLELFKVFDELRKHVSIVIVEHNLDLVLALADRVFALERGAVFHEGPAKPLLDALLPPGVDPADAPIVILNGDVVSDVDLRDVVRFHRERRALARILPHLVRPMPFIVPTTRNPRRSALLMRLGPKPEVLSAAPAPVEF